MSEKIFACLLRLYPAAFRQKYEDEVLQFYRERLRDESGMFSKARLYGDLFVDALTGIPQAWRNSYPESSAPLIAGNFNGLPSFQVLDREPLRPWSIVAGCVFSLTVLAGFGLVMRLPVPHPLMTSSKSLSPVEAVLERLNRVVTPASNDGDRAERSAMGAGQSQTQAQAVSASKASTTPNKTLTSQEREQVIQGVAENMTAHYFDQEKAHWAAERLRTLNNHAAYAGLDGRGLAERLTGDIRSATGDPHVNVEYSSKSIPTVAAQPSAAAIDRYRAMMIQQNCSLEKAEILGNQIGYVKLDSFPDMDICGAKIRAAIAGVSGSDAIIFDLRDNTGGSPETVAAVASALFDRTVAWYNPRETPSSTTLAPAHGSKLAKKPVYILTSSRTFSGAEHFTYNLKMLKRATVIGETTGGAAHTGVFHRVDDHFGIGIPAARITNPYGKADWSGVGVEPDVKVKASDALEVAEKLAAKQISRQ